MMQAWDEGGKKVTAALTRWWNQPRPNLHSPSKMSVASSPTPAAEAQAEGIDETYWSRILGTGYRPPQNRRYD
jgi:hypothetical protein